MVKEGTEAREQGEHTCVYRRLRGRFSTTPCISHRHVKFYAQEALFGVRFSCALFGLESNRTAHTCTRCAVLAFNSSNTASDATARHVSCLCIRHGCVAFWLFALVAGRFACIVVSLAVSAQPIASAKPRRKPTTESQTGFFRERGFVCAAFEAVFLAVIVVAAAFGTNPVTGTEAIGQDHLCGRRCRGGGGQPALNCIAQSIIEVRGFG